MVDKKVKYKLIYKMEFYEPRHSSQTQIKSFPINSKDNYILMSQYL
jgi:hypothetical protein